MEAEKRRGGGEKEDMSHVIHKVPAGDSPYGRAKHLQVLIRNPLINLKFIILIRFCSPVLPFLRSGFCRFLN